MSERIPVLVYYPKKMIGLMDKIKTEKYVSRSEMLRVAMRTLLGQTESRVLKEIRAMRADADDYYLKKAKGDYTMAAELELKDLRELKLKYWSRRAKESGYPIYSKKIESQLA